MRKLLQFTLLTLLATLVSVTAKADDVTIYMVTFSDISGNVAGDPNISYEAAKGSASTAPAIYEGEIRVYQNGGTFKVTANNGSKIKSVTLGSSMRTTVTYSVDGGDASDNQTITKNGTIMVDNLDCSSILFTCKGTSTSTRLYVNFLSVTYTPTSSNKVATPTFNPVEGEVGKGTSVSFNCATEGVTYYYTTNGDEPTTSSASSTSYTVNNDVTLKVIAVKDNMDNSDVATATYTVEKADPNLAFSETYVTANYDETFTPPTLTHAEEYDGTITYTSSNSAITVNETTGEVTFGTSAIGQTTTITATASATNNFKSGTASYALKVVDPNAITGNLNNATFGTNYSGSITPIANFSSETGFIDNVKVTYAKGSASNAYINNNEIRMYNGSLLSFTAPNGYRLTSLTFNTGLTDCSSDKGSISGKTWTTPEEEDVQVITITKTTNGALSLSSVTIHLAQTSTSTVAAPVFTETDGTTFTEPYTIHLTAESGLTIYYATGTDSPVDNKGNLSGAAIQYNGGIADLSKATTITAVAVDKDGNVSETVSASYKYNGEVEAPYYENFDQGLGNFTVEQEGTNPPIWEFQEITSGVYSGRKFAVAKGGSYNGTTRLVSPIIDLSKDNIESATLNFIHAGRYFEGNKNLTPEETASGPTPSHAQLFVRENGGSWVQLEIPCWFSQANSSASTAYDRFNSGPISLDEYKGKKIQVSFLFTADGFSRGTWNVLKFALTTTSVEKVNMNTDGYVTYVTKNDIDWTQTLAKNTSDETVNVHGYKVIQFSKESAVFAEFGVGENETLIPAETPIIIKGKRGINELVIARSENVIEKPSNNLLRPSYGDVTAAAGQHLMVFQKTSDWNESDPYNNYAFFKLKEGRLIPERKAYLNGADVSEEITVTTNAAMGIFLLEDLGNPQDSGTTGITQFSVLQNDSWMADGVVYDLSGRKIAESLQRMNGLAKGIYIVNGRKVVIK